MLRLHKQLHEECGGVCDWEEFGLRDRSSDLPVRGSGVRMKLVKVFPHMECTDL